MINDFIFLNFRRADNLFMMIQEYGNIVAITNHRSNKYLSFKQVVIMIIHESIHGTITKNVGFKISKLFDNLFFAKLAKPTIIGMNMIKI